MINPSASIIETTQESFETDVLERSKQVPVIVDFWATWCQPCRMLGPVLEKLAEEYQGKFVLVKAETERLPDIAAAFGIRSIPAVIGIKDGKIADSFVGVLPESEIRQFIGRLLPSEVEKKVAEARKIESSDSGVAERLYRQGLELDPHDIPAKIGLGRVLLAQGKADEAQKIISELERRGFLEPEAETLKAELTLQAGAEEAGDVEKCRKALAEAPENTELRFQLAEALAAAKQYEEALKLCLDLVEQDRQGQGEAARKLMLAIFQLLPADSELLNDYRRRLSVVL